MRLKSRIGAEEERKIETEEGNARERGDEGREREKER